MMTEKHNHHRKVPHVDSFISQHHAGLHHDHVADEAIGGHTTDLGAPYFKSVNFIGTVTVSQCEVML
jgi:hypothetical protein